MFCSFEDGGLRPISPVIRFSETVVDRGLILPTS